MLNRIIDFFYGPPDVWRAVYRGKPVVLITGELESGVVMTRRIDGVWQYRHATDDEEFDYANARSW